MFCIQIDWDTPLKVIHCYSHTRSLQVTLYVINLSVFSESVLQCACALYIVQLYSTSLIIIIDSIIMISCNSTGGAYCRRRQHTFVCQWNEFK